MRFYRHLSGPDGLVVRCRGCGHEFAQFHPPGNPYGFCPECGAGVCPGCDRLRYLGAVSCRRCGHAGLNFLTPPECAEDPGHRPWPPDPEVCWSEVLEPVPGWGTIADAARRLRTGLPRADAFALIYRMRHLAERVHRQEEQSGGWSDEPGWPWTGW